MSTLEATVSMLETMPEEARIKVFEYTRSVFSSARPSSPFTPAGKSQVMEDLEISSREFEQGQGLNAKDAINGMRQQHGFI